MIIHGFLVFARLVVMTLKGNGWIQQMDDCHWAWFVVEVLRVVPTLTGFVGVDRTVGDKKGICGSLRSLLWLKTLYRFIKWWEDY